MMLNILERLGELIKMSGFFLQQMASEFQQDSAVGIIGAVNRHLMEAEQLKSTGNVNW